MIIFGSTIFPPSRSKTTEVFLSNIWIVLFILDVESSILHTSINMSFSVFEVAVSKTV